MNKNIEMANLVNIVNTNENTNLIGTYNLLSCIAFFIKTNKKEYLIHTLQDPYEEINYERLNELIKLIETSGEIVNEILAFTGAFTNIESLIKTKEIIPYEIKVYKSYIDIYSSGSVCYDKLTNKFYGIDPINNELCEHNLSDNLISGQSLK